MWEVKLWFRGRKEGRKEYCFDCWWCNIDHLQLLYINLVLYVFQNKNPQRYWLPSYLAVFIIFWAVLSEASCYWYGLSMFKFQVWVRAKVFDLSKLHSFFFKNLYFSFVPLPSHLHISLLCFAARQFFFFPRLPSEFSCIGLLFPPGNPVWVEFRDFGQLSGISGHLAIHLKQDGKFYTCLCPRADDASSTCRGYCTDPRSTGLQSVFYTGGLGENGDSSLSEKTGVTETLLGSECTLVLLCPRADFTNICRALCPKVGYCTNNPISSTC